MNRLPAVFAAVVLLLLTPGCSRREPPAAPAAPPLETSTAAMPTPPPVPMVEPTQPLAARRAELEKKIADLTAGGAEVLDRAAFLQEQLGDVLAQQGKKDEAIAEYEKAAKGYNRTPEGTDMPRIRSEKAQGKADALRGPR